jgi:capsular polysaccharide export protein
MVSVAFDVRHRNEPRTSAAGGAPIVVRIQNGEQRHFLLIGGPFGGFTRALAAGLRRQGARCCRAILSGGDLYDWGFRDAQFYFGPPAGWRNWLTSLIEREDLTDIVLYGEAHPHFALTRRIAHDLSITVHMMEQGYFRPFWITVAPGDFGAPEILPGRPDHYLRTARSLPPPKKIWLRPLTPPAAWNLAIHHLVTWLAAPIFPRFRLTYEYSLPRQAFGHVRRYLNHRVFRARHERHLNKAIDGSGHLFIVALQRPGDCQLLNHSRFPTVSQLIEHVTQSFAKHAPEGARLLFKAHPLDHGIESHGKAVTRAADEVGMEDRIFFADHGDLHKILPRAAGVICINSTAGLAAIDIEIPTITLGTAIYAMPGLTHQGGLASFWTAPQKPDRQLYEAFRKVVMDRTQIAGAYATREGIEMIVPEAIRRLLQYQLAVFSERDEPLQALSAAN